MIYCAACHGLDRKGNLAGGFPGLVDVDKRRPRDQVALITKQGAGRMPAFDMIPPAQRRPSMGLITSCPMPHLPAPPVRTSPAPSPPRQKKTTRRTRRPPYAFAGFRRSPGSGRIPRHQAPWGTLNAVDLNTGEIKWKVPLGEYPELTARGLPHRHRELRRPRRHRWRTHLHRRHRRRNHPCVRQEHRQSPLESRPPFGGNATPSTYMVNGRQYLVISAGGGKSRRPAERHARRLPRCRRNRLAFHTHNVRLDALRSRLRRGVRLVQQRIRRPSTAPNPPPGRGASAC